MKITSLSFLRRGCRWAILAAVLVLGIESAEARPRRGLWGPRLFVPLFPVRPAPVLAPAPRGVSVFAVQSRLNARGYDAGPQDGVIGPMTSRAISNYQADHHLAVTGGITGSLLASLGL